MTIFSSSHDDGWLPADIDLGQIFIARDDQLDLFSFYFRSLVEKHANYAFESKQRCPLSQ